MSVRIDAAGDYLQRTTNLPSNTAFTVFGWSVVSSDQGSAVAQPLAVSLNGAFDGWYLYWESTIADAQMRIGCAIAGVESSGAAFGSRPATGTVFAWYIKCSGTGAGQLEGGWRAADANTWITASATMSASVGTLNDLRLGNVLGTYYLDGRFWNIKCWDRALSADELLVESFYRRPVFPSSLNFWWPLDSHTDLQDYGGNARSATGGGTLSTEDNGGQLWVPRPRRLIVVGGDTTAPVLTSPTGAATGTTTATIGATTDEGNGTLYGVVTTGSTQPSVAQIKAGQDHTGAAAAWGGSVAVSSTGAKTLNATGLTASTGYYGHLVHTDAASNDSNRVSSSQFTTDAASIGPRIYPINLGSAPIGLFVLGVASAGGTESRTLSSAGVGAFSPQTVSIAAVTLSSTGTGAASFASAAFVPAELSAPGTGAATFQAASVFAPPFASNGVAAVSWQSASLQAAVLNAAAAASVTFESSATAAIAFASDGAGAASWTSAAFNAQAISSTGLATVSFVGEDANGGAIERTFSADGAGAATFAAASFWSVDLTSSGAAAVAWQSAQIEPRALASDGAAAVSFDGQDANTGTVEARSFLSDGAGFASWFAVDANASTQQTIGGKRRKRMAEEDDLPEIAAMLAIVFEAGVFME